MATRKLEVLMPVDWLPYDVLREIRGDFDRPLECPLGTVRQRWKGH